MYRLMVYTRQRGSLQRKHILWALQFFREYLQKFIYQPVGGKVTNDFGLLLKSVADTTWSKLKSPIRSFALETQNKSYTTISLFFTLRVLSWKLHKALFTHLPILKLFLYKIFQFKCFPYISFCTDINTVES